MKKINKLVLATVVAVVSVGLITGNAFAAENQSSSKNSERVLFRQQVQQALNNKDFQAWKSLMGTRNNKILTIINQNNFDQFVQAHNLMKDGKIGEAEKIFQSLGLDRRVMKNGKCNGVNGDKRQHLNRGVNKK